MDEQAFGVLAERHRHELRVHCYRMLGSFQDAEDLVQETYLRAWRRRETYRGTASVRAWLYKIATNACLDFLDRGNRRAARYAGPPLAASASGARPPVEVAWLEPYPDRLLEPASPRQSEPDAVAEHRETLELAFLVAVQRLPARQRAVLILRDVLGWPTEDAATLLETSTASVKSALQRARATLKEHLPERRDDWSGSPAGDDQALVQRFVDAHERADFDVIAELLADDVRQTMPPHPAWLVGRDAFLDLTRRVLDPSSDWYHGQWRSIPTWANGQPAVANYVQYPTADETMRLDGEFKAQGLDVFTVDGGKITAITTFEPRVLTLFELPLVLP